MQQSYKPQGYSSLSPYIMADGAQRVIDFLSQAFDAVRCGARITPTARSCMPKSKLTTASS